MTLLKKDISGLAEDLGDVTTQIGAFGIILTISGPLKMTLLKKDIRNYEENKTFILKLRFFCQKLDRVLWIMFFVSLSQNLRIKFFI